MTTVATKELPTLHSTTVDISTTLQPEVLEKIKKGETAIVTSERYEQLITQHVAGVNMAQVQAIHAFDQHFIAGSMDAVGTASITAALADNKLTETSAEFHMVGKDRLNVGWSKAVERSAGIPERGKEAEKKIVHGAMSAKLTVAGADTGAGELNKVAKRQRAAALVFAGK